VVAAFSERASTSRLWRGTLIRLVFVSSSLFEAAAVAADDAAVIAAIDNNNSKDMGNLIVDNGSDSLPLQPLSSADLSRVETACATLALRFSALLAFERSLSRHLMIGGMGGCPLL